MWVTAAPNTCTPSLLRQGFGRNTEPSLKVTGLLQSGRKWEDGVQEGGDVLRATQSAGGKAGTGPGLPTLREVLWLWLLLLTIMSTQSQKANKFSHFLCATDGLVLGSNQFSHEFTPQKLWHKKQLLIVEIFKKKRKQTHKQLKTPESPPGRNNHYYFFFFFYANNVF